MWYSIGDVARTLWNIIPLYLVSYIPGIVMDQLGIKYQIGCTTGARRRVVRNATRAAGVPRVRAPEGPPEATICGICGIYMREYVPEKHYSEYLLDQRKCGLNAN